MTADLTRVAMTVASAILVLSATDAATQPHVSPASRAARFAEHQAECAGKDGWSDPAPPIRIFGNVYDIGTCGITVLLIADDAGAIVIDGATAQAAPAILVNVVRLGFAPADVKLLLSTHEHQDHAGGLHALRHATGAAMVAIGSARAALESGVPAADDPQRTGSTPEFVGVRVDRTVRNGETVSLGSLRLTAYATPGHAPGSTSWSWRSCERRVCHRIVYADSVSAIASDGYRFSDHPAYVAAFRASLAKIGALPCDLIVTPHPEASGLYVRLAGRAPLASPKACAAYAATGRVRLDRMLAKERVEPARR